MNENYGTLSETVNSLVQAGYTLDFNIHQECLICHHNNTVLSPDEFQIDMVYRFEGATNPDDESIVYAISSAKHGVKGILVNGYGLSADEASSKLVEKLQTHQLQHSVRIKKNEATPQRPEGSRVLDAALVEMNLPELIARIKSETTWAESDRNRVWKAAVARAVGLGSTQTALRAEIARLSTPPPDGTSGPARGPAERSTESAPSEASGGAGEATAAQASAWAASLDQTRDHVAAIAHMRHLEASVRSHGSHLTPAQIEIYAARAEALSPPDLYGARETPASLLRRCERWAREGAVAATPAQRRRAA